MSDLIDTAELRRLLDESIADHFAWNPWHKALIAAGPALLDALDSTRKALAESEAAGRQATEHLLRADRGRREAEAAGAVLRAAVESVVCDASEGPDAWRLTGKTNLDLLQHICSSAMKVLADLPASVRRHVAEHEALRELASFIPHECMWPAKRCAGCDGIKAARAKLDAARRGEG